MSRTKRAFEEDCIRRPRDEQEEKAGREELDQQEQQNGGNDE